MLGVLENTWPLLWVIAILVLVRWFHVNSLGAEPDDVGSVADENYRSHHARTQPI